MSEITRREMIGVLGGAALLPLVGCGADGGAGAPDGGGNGVCATVPAETGGPYPGDGSNGPNVLALSEVNRSDIRASIGGVSGTAAGIVLTLKMTVVDAAAGCAPLAGKAVYVWHCDRDADYSMYTGAAQAQNYLRGVQVTGADGSVTFTTVFPGCYLGRWPHIHFDVYDSLSAATSGGRKLKTSQLALPKEACDQVYATAGYGQSVTNLGKISLAADLAFADGAELETVAVSGTPTDGLGATITVGVIS
jgi:protocatechuate 3,4-dioxygenase beta subunit